jgi:hypothetical protein
MQRHLILWLSLGGVVEIYIAIRKICSTSNGKAWMFKTEDNSVREQLNSLNRLKDSISITHLQYRYGVSYRIACMNFPHLWLTLANMQLLIKRLVLKLKTHTRCVSFLFEASRTVWKCKTDCVCLVGISTSHLNVHVNSSSGV